MPIISGQDNIAINAARVVEETFRSPGKTSVIRPKEEATRTPRDSAGTTGGTPTGPRASAPAIVVSPIYKMAFLVVVAIVFMSAIGLYLMAGYWLTPSPNQQTVFNAAEFAFKAGIGAILGLLGGKVT